MSRRRNFFEGNLCGRGNSRVEKKTTTGRSWEQNTFIWARRVRSCVGFMLSASSRQNVGCRLYGRISSDSLIRLHTDCIFLRLNAPRIEIGHAAANAGRDISHLLTCKREFRDRLSVSCMMATSKFNAGEIVNSNLVIRGNLHIRSGARICGSVKSVKDMVIERRSLGRRKPDQRKKNAHWPALRGSRTGHCRTRTGHCQRNSMRHA